MRDSHFQGWRKPGPAAADPSLAPEPGESLDAISGDFRLFQLKNGHRFSTDDVLTAYYGTTWCPSAGRILDLGSGIGTVGSIAAWRLPGAKLTTIEAQEDSVRLARKSMRYNGLTDRTDVRLGDFRDPQILRDGEVFDLVLGSPPYFPMEGGVHGDHPQKIACRFEMRGDIGDYSKVAAQHLAPGGVFACCFPVAPAFQHERMREAAAGASLCIVRWRAVVFKEGEPPVIGLFALQRAVDLPPWFRTQTWEEPPLVIRRPDGTVHPEYRALKLVIGFPPGGSEG